jgi:hypothetical protein
MTRFLMLVAVAAVAGAMYVAAATGSQRAVPPSGKQFSALKKQVTRLKKSLGALKKDEGNVKALSAAEAGLLEACVAVAVPVDQFGDAQNHSEGFIYTQLDKSNVLTTALDAAASTDTNAVWFVGGDSSCGTALSGGTLQTDAAAAGLAPRHASVRATFLAHRP